MYFLESVNLKSGSHIPWLKCLSSIQLQTTYTILLDLTWLNRLLYFWVLKVQISVSWFLNHWVLYTRIFTAPCLAYA